MRHIAVLSIYLLFIAESLRHLVVKAATAKEQSLLSLLRWRRMLSLIMWMMMTVMHGGDCTVVNNSSSSHCEAR